MDEYLKNETIGYIRNVNHICKMLLQSLGSRSKAELWEFRKQHLLQQLTVNDYKIEFHGRGCRAFSEDDYLDWDFGYGSRWCGINPWLLATTLRKKLNDTNQNINGEYINEVFEKAIMDNEVYKRDDLYYFVIDKNEFIRPDFPRDFDVIIVEQFDKKWIVKNDILVKRFLRRSNLIWHHAGESDDSFLLSFIKDGSEVFRIFFDDISYPEGATRTFFEIINSHYACKNQTE